MPRGGRASSATGSSRSNTSHTNELTSNSTAGVGSARGSRSSRGGRAGSQAGSQKESGRGARGYSKGPGASAIGYNSAGTASRHSSGLSNASRISTDSGYFGDSDSFTTRSSKGSNVDSAKARGNGRVRQSYSKREGSRSLTDSGIETPSEAHYDSTASASNVRPHVDNAYIRHGTAGLPYGKRESSQKSESTQRPTSRMSVDEKTHSKVCENSGKPRDTMSDSKRHSVHHDNPGANPEIHRAAAVGNEPSVRVYKDNPLNRRLGRVGKPLGSMMYTRKGERTSKVYANNAFNRLMGRVGKPLGSQPITKKSRQTQKKQEILEKLLEKDEDTDTLNFDARCESLRVDSTPASGTRSRDLENSALREALYQINRILEEVLWKNDSKIETKLRTKQSLIDNFAGQTIKYKDISKGRKLGQGGFGEVFFGRWKGTIVAVKFLRQQKMSQNRVNQFSDEIQTFSTLNHPNIVKFIGACVESPNIALVMEYMQMSLFDAIHIHDLDFSDEERLSVLQQTGKGVQYLHDNKIAHCDLKSQNVLISDDREPMPIKISDFGLCMIKADAESSSVAEKRVSNVGTARYSAPEVLCGNELSANEMMKADIYSLALIFYEVVFQVEPFFDMNATQLQEQVGRKGRLPDIPRDVPLAEKIDTLIKRCLSKDPSNRPEINKVSDCLSATRNLYR